MTTNIREVVYLGRDNTIDLQLSADGAVVDLGSVTRMAVSEVTGKFAVDSADAPGAFDWSIGDGIVHLHLGDSGVEPGSYQCYLVVYDVSNPLGIVWGMVGISFVPVI